MKETPKANIINGLGGDDTISGLKGHDTITGGEGHDILYGHVGADTFFFEEGGGRDVIMDFDPSLSGEKIRIRVPGFENFQDVMDHASLDFMDAQSPDEGGPFGLHNKWAI